MSETDLIRVATFDSESEAQMAQTVLQDNNINSSLNGGDTAAFGLNIDGPAGYEVIVQRGDHDRAKELIDEMEAEEVIEIPAWDCPCGESVDEGFGMCWSCGAGYEPK